MLQLALQTCFIFKVNLSNYSKDIAPGNYQIFFVLKFDLVTGEFSKTILSPTFIFLASSSSVPTSMTLPVLGFSLAVSGIIIPLLVLLSSTSSGSTKTRSSKGFIYILNSSFSTF